MRLIYILILVFPSLAIGQSFKKGIILPKIDTLKFNDEYCCILSPKKGFSVYDMPNGKIIGTLKRLTNVKNDNQSAYKIYLITSNRKIEIKQFKEVEYEIFAINYLDQVKGFVKIIDQNKNYWLKQSEITSDGFKTINWMDYLLSRSKEVLGYYANDPGLKLRKEPNTNSDIIKYIKGNLFEIKLTNIKSGQWCKVIVTKYKEHPCETSLSDHENREYQLDGWMKIIADDGEPNIWSYVRGC